MTLRSTAREDGTAPRARAALSRDGEARDGNAREGDAHRNSAGGKNTYFCGDSFGSKNNFGSEPEAGSKKRAGRNQRSYRGATACLATMHGKEAAIAPPLRARLGLDVIIPSDIDTDAFGSFTGETPRPGDMLETAVAKARAGMGSTGARIGVASEGAYGAHPVYAVTPGGLELIVFIDDETGLTLSETLVVDETNFAHAVVSPGDDLDSFLTRARFPDHALVVEPNTATEKDTGADVKKAGTILKGLQSRAALDEAINRSAHLSTDKKALVQTDMRAHFNPTRMIAIARLAQKLATRLLSTCPECGGPGFGATDTVKGLPCANCGRPSELVKSEVFTCPLCDHREERPRSDDMLTAPPQYCLSCNP